MAARLLSEPITARTRLATAIIVVAVIAMVSGRQPKDQVPDGG